VVVEWRAPAEGGAWQLRAEARHAARGRTEGLRFPLLALWTAGGACTCAVAESGRVETPVALGSSEQLRLLIGLESTAERRHHLDPEAGFSVPYRMQLVPEEPP
jgi:hypothetical protein